MVQTITLTRKVDVYNRVRSAKLGAILEVEGVRYEKTNHGQWENQDTKVVLDNPDMAMMLFPKEN